MTAVGVVQHGGGASISVGVSLSGGWRREKVPRKSNGYVVGHNFKIEEFSAQNLCHIHKNSQRTNAATNPLTRALIPTVALAVNQIKY